MADYSHTVFSVLAEEEIEGARASAFRTVSLARELRVQGRLKKRAAEAESWVLEDLERRRGPGHHAYTIADSRRIRSALAELEDDLECFATEGTGRKKSKGKGKIASALKLKATGTKSAKSTGPRPPRSRRQDASAGKAKAAKRVRFASAVPLPVSPAPKASAQGVTSLGGEEGGGLSAVFAALSVPSSPSPFSLPAEWLSEGDSGERKKGEEKEKEEEENEEGKEEAEEFVLAPSVDKKRKKRKRKTVWICPKEGCNKRYSSSQVSLPLPTLPVFLFPCLFYLSDLNISPFLLGNSSLPRLLYSPSTCTSGGAVPISSRGGTRILTRRRRQQRDSCDRSILTLV